MQVALSEAKARLTDLVRRAERGEEVVPTRNGRPVARLAAVVTHGEDEEAREALKRSGWPR